MRVLAFAAALLSALACARPQAEAYAPGVSSRPILKTGVAADGRKLAYLRTEDPELTVLEVTISTGAETGWHHHPVPVYAYVQEGELEVSLAGGTARSYSRGQAIAEVLNLSHNGRNLGSAPVRLVVFYCGGKGIPNVVKDAVPGAPSP